MDLSQTQRQTQGLLQYQVELLRLLSMNEDDLKERIDEEVNKNPALSFTDGCKERVVGESSGIDAHQAILENVPDERETLRSHLLTQLGCLSLNEGEQELCESLIDNLDSNGYHILDPASLVKSRKQAGSIPNKNVLLAKGLDIVQHFDPAGVCVANMTESLKLQTRLHGQNSPLVDFLIDNLVMLDPPCVDTVQQKLHCYLKENGGAANSFWGVSLPFSKSDLTQERVGQAVDIIKSLTPHPASNFSPVVYRRVEVINVEKVAGFAPCINLTRGIVPYGDSFHFEISYDSGLPTLKINDAFADDVLKKSTFAKKSVQKAANFISILEYRNKCVVRCISSIVATEREFFAKGGDFLVPLMQKEIAQNLGVSDSTISRIVYGKYVNCAWGRLPVRHFFSRGIGDAEHGGVKSTTVVKKKVQQIAEVHPRFSDREIAQFLCEQGCKISRRTVAKYRSQMQLASSYHRVSKSYSHKSENHLHKSINPNSQDNNSRRECKN